MLQGAPLRLHLKLHSTQALQFSYLSWRDAGGTIVAETFDLVE